MGVLFQDLVQDVVEPREFFVLHGCIAVRDVQELFLARQAGRLNLVHFFKVLHAIPHDAVLETVVLILLSKVVADDEVDCMRLEC